MTGCQVFLQTLMTECAKKSQVIVIVTLFADGVHRAYCRSGTAVGVIWFLSAI
jgi:hypothetical protein